MRALKIFFTRSFISLVIIAALIAAIIFLCFYINSLLPAAAALAFNLILSLAAVIKTVCSDAGAEYKCAWLTLVAAFPLGGAALCLFSRRGNKGGGCYVGGTCTDVEYFCDGAEYLKRLEEEIKNAKERIYIEYYIIADGAVWRRLCAATEKKLDGGVEVEIVYDAWGSELRAPERDLKRLRKKGAKIKTFNRPSPIPVSRLNVRDHRKIAVIDGKKVFMGGVNIADEYAHITSPHGFWKDGGILLCGQLALECERYLYGHGKGLNTAHISYKTAAIFDGAGSGILREELTAMIYSAKERVYIFTPYLCCTEKLCGALAYAVRQGADVKIIIPSVPDKRAVFAISMTYARQLADMGVKVYEYTPGFVHFKGVLCDERAYVGSHNFDFRSMCLNYENGALLTGAAVDKFAADFSACLALSRPAHFARAGAFVRFKEHILRIFAPLV